MVFPSEFKIGTSLFYKYIKGIWNTLSDLYYTTDINQELQKNRFKHTDSKKQNWNKFEKKMEERYKNNSLRIRQEAKSREFQWEANYSMTICKVLFFSKKKNWKNITSKQVSKQYSENI